MFFVSFIETHPEMKKDEVIKGLTKQHFKDRRFQIMNQLISRADDTDLKPLVSLSGIVFNKK
jgi:hypothetical protein